ncbi:MAG TPA: hypothetical protein VFS00_24115, partial [Polyangiaceae bacterium]|nr:hypothetical protein [Polyangiaceae bacterium]
MPPPKTYPAETRFEREQDESRAVDCINVLLAQPPGSPRQYEEGQRLLGLIFAKIDQLCRRRYLPDDEAELAALCVVERIRRNDFHNLRAFARWHSVVDRSEIRPLREVSAAPARTFDNWLRQLCRWEVRRRLRPFCRPSSFDEVDVAALPDPDVSCPELTLIERELKSQEGAIMDLALEALDDRQRAALRAYARRGEEAA